MTGFRGSDDSGRQVAELDPVNLRELLQQAAGSVLVEPSATSGVAATARRIGTEGWIVEVRSGVAAAPLSARVPNTDAAYDLLRSWCADDGWWRDAFSWAPVEP